LLSTIEDCGTSEEHFVGVKERSIFNTNDAEVHRGKPRRRNSKKQNSGGVEFHHNRLSRHFLKVETHPDLRATRKVFVQISRSAWMPFLY